jgi:soluble cytochrome b562
MNKALIIPSAIILSFALSTAQADTPLEMSMKNMSKAYKQLALDLKAPQEASKADYLALAGTLKTETTKSRDLVPQKAENLYPESRDAMIKDYQKSMDDLGVTIDTLTQDIQAGNWDDANKQMATIKQQMIDGHKAFRVKK